MNRYVLRGSLAVLGLALVSACAEEIPVYTPTAAVQAVFDPSSSPPSVPTPTDLARDPATGLLRVPVADSTTAQAQAYFDTFLNTLNGFPTSATAEVKFTAELDAASVTKETLLVFDLSDAAKPVRMDGVTLEADRLYDRSDGTKASLVRIWNFEGWKRGTRYAFFVRGGPNGVKAKDGKQVIRSALFELAAADKPLCAWDEAKSWDASSKSCLTLRDGKPATGCCTYNYSALIESSVKKTIREKMKDASIEEQDKAIHAETLAKATDFERIRRGYAELLPLVEAAGWSKADVAVLWSFTTVSMNEAVFDPSAAVPQLPTPTDLAKDPTTGLLNIPTAPTASEAEKAFNAYLSSLDGYPASTSSAVLSFTGELDPASVGASTLKVFEAGASGVTPTADVTATWDATRMRVVVSPKGGFSKRGATYLVAALGGDSGLKNKDATLAAAPKRSALMHLVLSPYPLCSFDATAKKCTNVGVSSFIDDPKQKTGGRTALEKATLFELLRQGFDPVLKAMEAAGVKREEVISLFSFTIVSMTELVFDPTAGVIPYPNNLLLDPAGLGKDPPEYKVKIDPRPNESPLQAAIRTGLNTLDGFTTLGKYFVVTTGKVDPASIVPLQTAALINLDTKLPVLDAKIEWNATAGAITVTPTRPLDEKTMYGIVLTSKLKAGDPKPDGAGIKDDKGRRVVPAPFMVLLRSKAPLVDGGKSTVSTLDDATAKQAEQARLALMPFFDGLEANTLLPIKREEIVSAWTFRTQSITETVTKLRALPWQVFGPVDANQPKWQGAIDPTFTAIPWPASYPKDNLAAIGKGAFISWLLIDEAGTGAFLPDPAKGKAVGVPFYLTLPKGTMPASGWPLVVLQHGIFDDKTLIFEIADSFAKEGYATLAFDLLYHGERSWCTKDAHCDGGGTCDTAKGSCSTKLKADAEGKPDASGERFLNLSNPFAIRDNMRQYAIDGSALLRSLALGSGPSGLQNIGGNKFDPAKVFFVGQSFGSIHGTMLMAADPLVSRCLFNVPGSTLTQIFLNSPEFKSRKDAMLASLGIKEGSLDYLQLLETTFQWIVDPSDPASFAKYIKTAQLPDLVKSTPSSPVLVPKKEVIVQLAEKDETIPLGFGSFLAAAMGVDTAQTVFAGQDHGFLFRADPDQKATDAARAQALHFLTNGLSCSGGKTCTPNLTSGTCVCP